MIYELAKKLKDAGFPQYEDMIPAQSEGGGRNWPSFPHCGRHLVMDEPELVDSIGSENCKKRAAFCYKIEYLDSEEGKKLTVYLPTLGELIEACGDNFRFLEHTPSSHEFICFLPESTKYTTGPTPEEAVAHLYLALHGK